MCPVRNVTYVSGRSSRWRASGGRPSGDGQGEGCLPKLRPERRKTVAHLWYVYFLELSNGDIYVGSTDDLRRRLASHRQGRVVSTSKHLPAVLRSYVAVADEATGRFGRAGGCAVGRWQAA